MYLKISQITEENLSEAQQYFPNEYQNMLILKPFFQESLVARYFISYFLGNKYLPEVNSLGIPLFKDKKWSLSHKNNLVFIGVSDDFLGIDIEFLEEKSFELLEYFSQELYDTIGGKNWKNFYILWTAYEAIQKYERLEDIDIGEYILINMENILLHISDIYFYTRCIFESKGKVYQVFTGFQENIVYSLCTSQTFLYEKII